MKTLGERVSAVREQRGFTQGDVARRSGLPQQAISRLERGERQHVRSDVLARLAIALHISADVLLGLQDLPTTVAPLVSSHDAAQEAKPTAKHQRTRQSTPVA